MRCDWNLAQTQFGIVLEYFRLKEEEREFILILTKQEWKERKVKRKRSKVKGKRRVR